MCHAANSLRFPIVIPCSYQHPIGFIVLCEVIRNGKIRRSSVQRLHVSVNHRAVHCIRLAGKIFMNFTRIDFRAEKMSRLCTALYGKADFRTLLYADFAYRAAIRSFASGKFYTLP